MINNKTRFDQWESTSLTIAFVYLFTETVFPSLHFDFKTMSERGVSHQTSIAFLCFIYSLNLVFKRTKQWTFASFTITATIVSWKKGKRDEIYDEILFSSRSPSPRRSKRSSPRRGTNEVHRENPIPSAVLGVFGLSQYTTESDLKDLFHKFGRIKDVQIVIDKKTNRSRGFGFVYFEEVEHATRVWTQLIHNFSFEF